MASILRSSKFLRHLAGFARCNALHSRSGSLIQNNNQYLNPSFLSRAFSTPAVLAQPNNRLDVSLEKSLRRLDQDVRRSGRISRRELEDILHELRNSSSATSSQSLLIIRCCGNLIPEESPEVRTKLVTEIWNTLDNMGVSMDISHYNALLRVYLENEHTFSPTEFLAELDRKGIEANRVTYQRLIARYCQLGDIDGATRILEFMREKQLPVNESVFNALILGHSQGGDLASAAGIVDVMKHAGLQPSADTYTALLCAHAKVGDMQAITDLLQVCREKEIDLLDKDYMDVIYALATNGHAQLVDPIIALMTQSMGYNHTAVNLILRLINAGQSEVGYKVLSTMPRPTMSDGQLAPVGSFFIRQMVKCGQSMNTVLEMCQRLEESGVNERALMIACEYALQSADQEQALNILKTVKERGFPVRQHYFWPMLITASRSKDLAAVLRVLSGMNHEFGLVPSRETLRDYVVPHLDPALSTDQVVGRFRSAGIAPQLISAALVAHLLNQDKLAEAAALADRHGCTISAAALRRPMSVAFSRTRDAKAYVSLLQSCGAHEARQVDSFVLDVTAVARTNRPVLLKLLLQALASGGLSMSNSTALLLQEQLGEQMTPELTQLITQLTALGDTPAKTARQMGKRPIQMDEAGLQSLLISLTARGEPTVNLRKQLLSLHCRNRDLVKAEEVKATLDQDQLVYTGGLLAQLIELYAHHDQLEKALEAHKLLRQRDPEFTLDDGKVIKLAGLLVKQDRLDDAVQLLQEEHRVTSEEPTFVSTAQCWKLLNGLAEAGKITELKLIFDTLLQHHFITPTNVLLGPLVKVHIVKGDLAGALSEFEACCLQYRATPWKNELACKLIQAEDAAALQRLTDLSTNIHGEVNSLYDLVFAFVECGKLRQAKKILETAGLSSRPQRIKSACQRYREEGLVAPLEGLINATQDMAHLIDRSQIFIHLLHSYCKSNEAEKGLALWTRMQEEDVAISDEFLLSLAKLLRKNDQSVPFVVPSGDTQPQETKTETKSVVQHATVSQLRVAIRNQQLEAALEAKQRVDAEHQDLTVTDLSTLIELLVKNERFQEASDMALKMLSENIHPLPRIFRFLLNSLAKAGMVESIEKMSSLLTPEQKRVVSFDNRLCFANVMAGNALEYLTHLEQEVNKSSESDWPMLADKFPKGGAITILHQHPELTTQFEEMARSYAVRNILAPINVLWMYLFVSGQESKAGQIWCEFLSQCPQLMFQHVVQTARKNSDALLAERLVKQLVGMEISPGATGNAYSCLLDILVGQGKSDEALAILDSAVKEGFYEHINSTALTRLSETLQSEGKTFPHSIPKKVNK